MYRSLSSAHISLHRCAPVKETVLLMTKMQLKIISQSLNNVNDALINWVGLSDGSDLLAEEMKIGMEFYIHYTHPLGKKIKNIYFLNSDFTFSVVNISKAQDGLSGKDDE